MACINNMCPSFPRWIFWFKEGTNEFQMETVCEASSGYACVKYESALLGASAQVKTLGTPGC